MALPEVQVESAKKRIKEKECARAAPAAARGREQHTPVREGHGTKQEEELTCACVRQKPDAWFQC
jgi:hypothetical protein